MRPCLARVPGAPYDQSASPEMTAGVAPAHDAAQVPSVLGPRGRSEARTRLHRRSRLRPPGRSRTCRCEACLCRDVANTHRNPNTDLPLACGGGTGYPWERARGPVPPGNSRPCRTHCSVGTSCVPAHGSVGLASAKPCLEWWTLVANMNPSLHNPSPRLANGRGTRLAKVHRNTAECSANQNVVMNRRHSTRECQCRVSSATLQQCSNIVGIAVRCRWPGGHT